MSRPTTRLKALLASRSAAILPGTPNALFARVIAAHGFPAVYVTGAGIANMSLGVPDIGLVTLTEIAGHVAAITDAVEVPVLVDADTGFGNALNVTRTVRLLERAGAAGIQLEDQVFPKKCGHTPFKRVTPTIDMVEKIKVACEARTSDETLIIARTDARQTDGYEETVRRGIAYAEAGADVVFLEALESEEEMRDACRRINAPLMANMADGGNTPIRSAKELEEIGYSLAIYPAMTSLAAAQAAENVLTLLKTEGTSLSPKVPLFSFAEFNKLIGFQEVWDFEKKWARDHDAPAA